MSHKVAQTSCQTVSLRSSLESLFAEKEFKETYFRYNSSKHKCTPGVFLDFCCGDTFNSLSEDPYAIQIQLGCDDFVPLDSLKPRAMKYKICATYFQIRNMPAFYRSKLENFKLVALAKTEDLKQDDTSFDNVARFIVEAQMVLWV